ncbi:MAG: AAA family ATPase, partial [Vicinamibacterales bacterium]
MLARAPGGENWIETLARRGYRFIGPVTTLQDRTARDTASSSPRSNLPELLTSFVGRARELAQIQKLLSSNRLVTLIGAGGVGKTRLALRVATQVLDANAAGVWLVELANLRDPWLVPQTLATVLGLKEQPGKSLTQTLTEYLQARSLLLVLDNAEHLLPACAQLVETVLRQCPQVVLLVTSRERLGVAGELTYRVPSLSTPEPKRDNTAESLARYESVQLFSERAQLLAPQFAVT